MNNVNQLEMMQSEMSHLLIVHWRFQPTYWTFFIGILRFRSLKSVCKYFACSTDHHKNLNIVQIIVCIPMRVRFINYLFQMARDFDVK